MSNNLDPDQAGHLVGPYLGSNWLQRSLADDTSRQRVEVGVVFRWVNWVASQDSFSADPGVASSILAQSHTFVVIDHEIISTVISFSADSRRGVVSYKWKVCARNTG